MVPAAIGRIPPACLGVSASACTVGGTVAELVHRRIAAGVTRSRRREHGRVRTLNRVIRARRSNRWRCGVYYKHRLAACRRMVTAAIGRIPPACLGVSARARTIGGTVADLVHSRIAAGVTGRRRREHWRVRTLDRVIRSSRPNRWRCGVYYKNRLAACSRMVPAAISRIPSASLGVSARARTVGGTVTDLVHRRIAAGVTGRRRREHWRVRTLNRVIGARRPNRRRSGILYRDGLDRKSVV